MEEESLRVLTVEEGEGEGDKTCQRPRPGVVIAWWLGKGGRVMTMPSLIHFNYLN